MSSIVAVVTPVFNGAAYLASAIESVRAQTYPDWAMTIVDNASSDETPEIAARHAAVDSRVRHLRFSDYVDANENHLRAFALGAEGSDYCKILQADDRMFPKCLEAMVTLGNTAPQAGIIGGYRLRGDVIDLAGLPRGVDVAKGATVLRQSLLGGPYVTGSPSSLLYRSELVRARVPFLDLEYWHSDTEVAYWAFTQADFALVHDVVTYSRRQAASRISWANAMNTYDPENIRLLLRYGPVVLRPDELKSRLRLELTKYLTFLTKQRLKRPRSLVDGFWSFHGDQIRMIVRDAGSESDLGMFPRIAGILAGGRRP